MDHVICTAANGRYFGSAVNLIGSLHRHHPEGIDIRVYDLGLSVVERRIVETLELTTLHDVPRFCAHALEPDLFAWKIAAIHDTLHSAGGAVLWLDAGTEAVRPLDALFRAIERDGCLFNVCPYDYAFARVGSLTTKRCLDGMDASAPEYREAFFVNAGIQGYLSGHPACAVIDEAMRYAADPGIIGGSRSTHRQDQSIVSVLRVRHGLPATFWLAPDPADPERWPTLYTAGRDHPIPIEAAEAIMVSSPGYLKVKRRNAEYMHAERLRWNDATSALPLRRVLRRRLFVADMKRCARRLRESVALFFGTGVRGNGTPPIDGA
jgi:hypothetical protein